MAASETNAVTNVMSRKSHSAHLPIRAYPSTKLVPVAAAYLAPNSKNGYLRTNANRMTSANPNPAVAPARVDCTR